jgi:hypothetical protein
MQIQDCLAHVRLLMIDNRQQTRIPLQMRLRRAIRIRMSLRLCQLRVSLLFLGFQPVLSLGLDLGDRLGSCGAVG